LFEGPKGNIASNIMKYYKVLAFGARTVTGTIYIKQTYLKP
jgi:hypothetical protein